MSLADKIINDIETKHITPIAKKWYWLRTIALWALFALTIIAGSVATSLLILAMQGEPDEIRRGIAFEQMALSGLPTVLIITTILMIVAGIFIYKSTRYGYRNQGYKVLLFIVITSISLGSIFHVTHAGFKGHKFLMTHSTSYKKLLLSHQKSLWSKPEKGLLSGTIIKVNFETFQIKDWNNQIWIIDDIDAHWRNHSLRQVGQEIRIIGKIHLNHEFDADVILPWKFKGKRLQAPQFNSHK